METSSKIRIGGMALVSVLLFAPKAIAAANQDGTELATSQTVMSFDESIAGWHGNVKGGIVLTHDRNVKKRGAGSLRIDGSQPGSFGAPLALARNQPYRIGCWVKTDGRCVLRPYLSVEDAKQQRYGVYSGPPLNSTSFAYFEVGFHPSMMARDGRDLHLRFQELVPGTAWVDEVTVTMMDPVPNAESGGIRVYGGKRHAAITAPWVRQPPDIDGVPDEAVWGGVPAMVLEDYISAGNAQGEARIVCDGKFLYLAIECPEPSHEIMADPNRAHDGDLWQDDSVEVFLAPEHGSETYYQFIVNARGATREAKMGAKAGRKLQTDLAWTCNWTSAVWRGDNRWAVELAIPCHAVEVKPSCLLGVNVCRNYVTAKRNASWARLAGGSVFLSFHQPNLFGKLLLADDQLNVTVRSLGQRQAGQNQLLLETQNEGTVRELSFQVADDDNPTVCTETTQNIPPGKGTVSLPYTLRSGKQDVAILAREKGRGGVPVFDLAMLRVRAVGPDALALQSIRDKLQFLAVLTKGSSEIADLHKTLGRFAESPPGSTTSECSGQRPSAEEYEAFAQRVEKVAARTMDAKVLAYPDARESLRLAISDARIQGPFEVTDSPAAVSLSPAGWADFGVTIPAAGRYRFEIACGTPAGQKSLPARFALLLNRRVLGTTWCLTKAEDAAAEQFAFVPIGSARVVESGKHVLRVMPLREPTRWLSGVRITLVGDHPGPPILSFVQFTDTHVGGLYYIHRALASCIPDVFRDAATYINDCLKPDFVVATGDVAAAPQEALLKQAAALLSLFKAPCYVVNGNHDSLNNVEQTRQVQQLYRAFMPGSRTYYSFDIKGCHFIALDDFMAPPDRQEQSRWLEENLANNSTKPLIAFSHVPQYFAIPEDRPYLVRCPDQRNEKGINADWRPLFQRHGKLIAMFSGHRHFNEINIREDICFATTAPLCGWPMVYRHVLLYANHMEVRTYQAPPRYFEFSYIAGGQKGENNWLLGNNGDIDREVPYPAKVHMR